MTVSQHEKGAALLLTLLITILLSLLIFDMTHKSRMMFTKARYASDGIKAFYLAKSGMNMGML
ncbi:MAG: hypothetical protein AB1488_07495, partial [Nitrospirota bacterium]